MTWQPMQPGAYPYLDPSQRILLGMQTGWGSPRDKSQDPFWPGGSSPRDKSQDPFWPGGGFGMDTTGGRQPGLNFPGLGSPGGGGVLANRVNNAMNNPMTHLGLGILQANQPYIRKLGDPTPPTGIGPGIAQGLNSYQNQQLLQREQAKEAMALQMQMAEFRATQEERAREAAKRQAIKDAFGPSSSGAAMGAQGGAMPIDPRTGQPANPALVAGAGRPVPSGPSMDVNMRAAQALTQAAMATGDPELFKQAAEIRNASLPRERLNLERDRLEQQREMQSRQLDLAKGRYQELLRSNASTEEIARAGLGLKAQEVQAKLAELWRKDFKSEGELRGEFTKQAKDFVVSRDAYEKLKVSASGKSEGTGAGDLALIYNYAKMLSPDSTVMQGEQEMTARNAQGVPDAMRAQYNSLLNNTGATLSPEARGNIRAQAETLFGSQAKLHIGLEDEYRRLAERNRLDPENVVVDYVGQLRGMIGSGASDTLGVIAVQPGQDPRAALQGSR